MAWIMEVGHCLNGHRPNNLNKMDQIIRILGLKQFRSSTSCHDRIGMETETGASRNGVVAMLSRKGNRHASGIINMLLLKIQREYGIKAKVSYLLEMFLVANYILDREFISTRLFIIILLVRGETEYIKERINGRTSMGSKEQNILPYAL